MSSRNQPCECGSGERYKHCCGSLNSQQSAGADSRLISYADQGLFPRQLRGRGMERFCQDLPSGRGLPLAWSPPGLAVTQNFLSADQCDELVNFLSKQPTADASVDLVALKSGEIDRRVDQQRITKAVELGEKQETVIRYVVMAFRDVAVPYFEASLDTFETPSALKYLSGGRFDLHADSEQWSDSEQRWVRTQNRDFSLLLYLNDGYTGGTICFPNFNIEIEPRRGMLLTFPSDHRFVHAAKPVISGERYVIASWGVDKATPKI